MRSSAIKSPAWAIGVLIAGLLLVGCVDDGVDGAAGAPGASTANLTGVVTNALSGTPLSGAVVTTDPVVPGVNIVAGPTGAYNVELPIGNYDLICNDANFVPGTGQVSLVAGQPATANFGLMPEHMVMLSITGLPAGVGPGDSFGLTISATPMDGSAVTGYAWSQTNSVQATLQNTTSPTVTVTLGTEQEYRDELFGELMPLERWMVQGVDPFAIEEAGHNAFQVVVTTTSGTYTETIDVHTHMDFVAVSPGLRNVPIGLPVLLNGKTQATYDWTLGTPAGSSAALNSAALQRPTFTPDMAGRYVVTVTDLDDGVQTFDIYAGTWEGAITGQDGNGRPEAANCNSCHQNLPDANLFGVWKESGHAEIFTNNLNTSTHYGSNCFPCHTVGYDTTVANGGIDEQTDFNAFLNAGLLNNPGDNWTTVLGSFPNTARMANIQCENCHGPNNGPPAEGGHMRDIDAWGTKPRIDLTSAVCATCHGEPKRHARFQQWELSGHANYDLAESRGTSGSCGRCHSANGFIQWVPNLLDSDPGNDFSSVNSTDVKHVHPQTCVACHDPHDVGTSSGSHPNAKVRIMGDSPRLEAGFSATAVGSGALCMTCHNGRRGLRNDLIDWSTVGDKDRAPHGRPNASVLMGQNMYFMEVGTRSAHSLITNTCVTCHMELTDPPAELSYNLGGTNHTFEADADICSNCHGAFTAETVELATDTAFNDLAAALEKAIKDEIEYQIALGYTVHIEGATEDEETDLEADITDIGQVGFIHLETSHGRQAMTIVVDGVEIHHCRLGGDTDILDAGVPIGSLVSTDNGEIIAKAGWNYWVVDHDGSHGIHNPTFIIDALTRAKQQLDLLTFIVPVPE